MDVAQAAAALSQALRAVPASRVYTDPGATIDPPAAILGPPALYWSTGSPAPTMARFSVFAVAAMDDRAAETLWALVPELVAAIEAGVRDAVVTPPALPGVYPTSGGDLPCYEIQIEVEL